MTQAALNELANINQGLVQRCVDLAQQVESLEAQLKAKDEKLAFYLDAKEDTKAEDILGND